LKKKTKKKKKKKQKKQKKKKKKKNNHHKIHLLHHPQPLHPLSLHFLLHNNSLLSPKNLLLLKLHPSLLMGLYRIPFFNVPFVKKIFPIYPIWSPINKKKIMMLEHNEVFFI